MYSLETYEFQEHVFFTVLFLSALISKSLLPCNVIISWIFAVCFYLWE